ncbi:hybrid sensor histidine kinase/response regulator [Monaibacterium marinum]|uniref:hybrid sensor histidine kinase/response regulator n=1 Tax=Pontivivens marinum TaxID=1690039 RepID=UPI0015E05EFC|nr:PAS domain-containing hybrid sensor histidine kinase/response regulator [Monaibacterium marinum]
MAITVLLGLLLSGAAVLAVLGSQVNDELRALRTASSDNIEWNLPQLEVDLLNLQLALEQSGDTDPVASAAAIRHKFDLFYSRVQSVTEGETFNTVRDDSNVADRLDDVRTFLDEKIPVIDAPDAVLLARTDDLIAEASLLRTTLRQLAVYGVSAFAQQSTLQREKLSALLTRTSTMLVSMIIALAAVLAILFRQFGVSEREGQKRKLTNMRLRAVIRTSLDAIIVVDNRGLIIDFNGAATEIFGYTHEEAIGLPVADAIIPERFRNAHSLGLTRFIRTGEKTILDTGLVVLQGMRKDGSELPVEMSVASAEGPHGTIFVAFVREITERLRVQEELTAARDDALAADKAKSTFLAVMSHEMRTPLNGIMGTLELLANTDIDKKQRAYVQAAQTSGSFLMRHINDVLDISKVHASKLQLTNDVFSPATLADEVVDANRANASARGNEIRVEAGLDHSVYMVADRFRVSQTLLNLVGNAIKFTSNGSVQVGVQEIATEDGPMVEFRVNDTGIGIASDKLGEVFDDFVTIDTSYSRRSDGTGLGLGISKRMATAMGGSIGVESDFGSGSSFWFRIPLVRGEKPEEKPDSQPDTDSVYEHIAPLSVLLVEDNAINSFVAREMLVGLGHEVTEAGNGLMGVEAAENQHFDIILMDISMPVMDGVTATIKIRESSGQSRDTPIVGLTAHALPEEMARFREIGMQDCMIKPITIACVTEMLANHANTPIPIEGEDDAWGEESDDGTYINSETCGELIELLGEQRFRAAFANLTDEAVRTLQSIPRPTVESDLPEVQGEVHKLAGAAATFGATVMQQHLSIVEAACKRQDVQAVNEGVGDLDTVWKMTREELEALLE